MNHRTNNPVQDTYVFSQVNHERRERALEDAEKINYAEDAKARLCKLNLHAQPLPPIPHDLIDILQIIIPGEGPQEGDVIGGNVVTLTEKVWKIYRDKATPYLAKADAVRLQEAGDTLMIYWGYVVAYLGYTRHQAAYWDAYSASLEARYNYLKGEFTLHYSEATDNRGAELKATVVRIFVNNDPAIRDLHDRLHRCRAVVKHLDAHIKSLESVEKLCSRMLTRHLKDHSGPGVPHDPHQTIRDMQRQLRKGGEGGW